MSYDEPDPPPPPPDPEPDPQAAPADLTACSSTTAGADNRPTLAAIAADYRT